MLLVDRELIGHDWVNWLNDNDIPFAIRVAINRHVIRSDGRRVKLATQITHHKRGRCTTATLGQSTGFACQMRSVVSFSYPSELKLAISNDCPQGALK